MHKEVAWDWKTMPLSKSMIHMFGSCPYRFYLQCIKHIEPTPSPEMERGTILHAALDQLYKNIDKDKICDRETLIGEYVKYLPPHEMMIKFVDLEADRFELLQKENKTSIFWPTLTEHYLIDDKLWYYGTLDRLDKLENGNFVVLDYKMGKFHKWLISDYRFELMGYKHLIETNRSLIKANTGLEVTKVVAGCMIFLGEKTPMIHFEEIKAATERAFYSKIGRIRERITECNATGEWPKKISRLCGWCPFMGKNCEMEGQVTSDDQIQT